jgi:hypothetical protein
MAAEAATQASFSSAQVVNKGSIRVEFVMTLFARLWVCLGGRLRGHDEQSQVGPIAQPYYTATVAPGLPAIMRKGV